MRVVLDTNVLMSALFFGGVPGKVVEAWVAGRFALVASPLILGEYRRVGEELAVKYPRVDIGPILDLITVHAEVVEDRPLMTPVCRDPNDDPFVACAVAAGAMLISGDRDLLAVNETSGVRVLTPRAFLNALKEN